MSTSSIPPVTIKDIAQYTGSSCSAVSQALSGKGRLSPALRKKIITQAEKMGYRRNTSATSLIMSRWHRDNQPPVQRNIALVTHVDEATKHIGEIVRKTVAQLCEEAGHGFMHIELSDFPRTSTWKKQLESRGVEGVIISIGFDETMLADPFWENFTVVKCGSLGGDESIHGVQSDPYMRIYHAMDLLASRSYHRIGFVFLHHVPFNTVDLMRVGAWHTLRFKYPRSAIAEPLMFPFAKYTAEKGPVTPESEAILREKYIQFLVPSLSEWIQREKPQAIVSLSEEVYDALIRCGIKVPDDIGFLNLIMSKTCRNERLQLAGYQRGNEKIAYLSLRLLEQLLQYPFMANNGPIRMVLPSDFIDGTTLRKG